MFFNTIGPTPGALPDQFDLRTPDVWLKDRKYPVRVFGFGNFEGGIGTVPITENASNDLATEQSKMDCIPSL